MTDVDKLQHIDDDESTDMWNSFCGEVADLEIRGGHNVITMGWYLDPRTELDSDEYWCPKCLASDKLALLVLQDTEL